VTTAAPDYHSPFFGRERLEPRLRIPRHRHESGYVTVILSGRYQEAGFAGRFDLTAGDVAVHPAFDAHLDQISISGAEVLNLPLLLGADLPSVFSISDPDLIVRLAEGDAYEAAFALSPVRSVSAVDDWPDRLAATANEARTHPLGYWADLNGLAPETLSRGFRKAYGVTPARYRTEKKVQAALRLIVETSLPLADVAIDCGFADQPHLTRAIVRFTGRSPGYWRRGSNPFKTGRATQR
jgi:AraC-like DNA-binding protein